MKALRIVAVAPLGLLIMVVGVLGLLAASIVGSFALAYVLLHMHGGQKMTINPAMTER
ncbi:MAG: hypothetical protein V3T08_09335 [Gemmatimonadota bacterium]